VQVEIQMAQGGEALDDACLRRWLRADRWVVPKAEARLKAHAKWRASVAPSGRIEQARTAAGRPAAAPGGPRFATGIRRRQPPIDHKARATFLIVTAWCPI